MPDNAVTLRPVKIAASEGPNVMVESGVSPGDLIVVDGLDRLREGAKIELVQRDGVKTAESPPAPGENGHQRRRTEKSR